MTKTLLIALLTMFCPLFVSAQDEYEPPKGHQTVGWIEKLKLSPGDLILRARLDPAKNSSSLYAENIKKMRKNRKLWVSFELMDQYGNSGKVSSEVIRTVKVKVDEKKTKEDPVVRLGMCLGKTYFEDEIRLTDKKHEEYDMQLGRQALEGNFLIDPGAKLTSNPECGDRGKDLGETEPITADDSGSESGQ